MKRLVVWGGATGLESHRHIHRGFYNAAGKMGIPTKWIHDDANGFVFEEGDVVIAADIWNKHLRYQPGVDYVLHNFNADHPVIQQADPDRVLRLQVWTTDAFGEEWDMYRQYDRPGRILFQPWGTDLMADQFMKPVFNPHSTTVVFVGAVWSDTRPGFELGNKEAIGELDDACRARGLNLVTYTQIPEQQMIQVTREARLAPTVLGGWQVEHGYIPCRAFKHASYGLPVFTNSGYVDWLFNDAERWAVPPIGEILDKALALSQDEYEGVAKNHQEIARRYTYRESLAAIERALEEGREGPQDGPFLEWREHARMSASILAQRSESFREILVDSKIVLEDAAEHFNATPEAAVLIRALVRSLKEAIPFVTVGSDQKIRDTCERGVDFLRHYEGPSASLEVVQELRDVAARIGSALE